MTLREYIRINKQDVLDDLQVIVRYHQKAMQNDPDAYHDIMNDELSMDIRLCVDRIPSRIDDDTHDQQYMWIFRTGDSSFDQRHSDYCAASCIQPDTTTSDLLEELTDDLLEQAP